MKTRLILAIILIFALIDQSKHFYLNIYTHSLPSGIYYRIDKSPNIGDYAASCLTPEIAEYGLKRGYLGRGDCSTGIIPIMKVIKGVPGTHFSFKNKIFKVEAVNQKYILKDVDSIGRPLKKFYNTDMGFVKKQNYILLSNYVPNSWDSRYWGAVPIEFILKPLITW